MPRPCTICSHAQQGEINAALLHGEPYRSVAKQFSLSAPSLFRHRHDHLPAALSQAKAVQAVADGNDLLNRLTTLTRETEAILREARKGKAKDNETALKAIGRLERQLELHIRFLGELSDVVPRAFVMKLLDLIRTVLVATLGEFGVDEYKARVRFVLRLKAAMRQEGWSLPLEGDTPAAPADHPQPENAV